MAIENLVCRCGETEEFDIQEIVDITSSETVYIYQCGNCGATIRETWVRVNVDFSD